MKKIVVIILFLSYFKIFAQNDSKIAFQKNKYELALSYYKKADYKKSLDMFSIASRIKPENEVGKESSKMVDTLKGILRKNIMDEVAGIWKMKGNKPTWAVDASKVDNEISEEFIEVTNNKILFYEVDKKTKIRKDLNSEEIVYFNNNASDAMFSDIILSDGTIWSCSLNENAEVLRVINIGKKDENGVTKITTDNKELFYTKVIKMGI